MTFKGRLSGRIGFTYSPIDAAFGIETQRSPESTSTGNPSTSTSNHVTVGTLDPGVLDFKDALPIGAVYYYRNRQFGEGYDPSGWSTWKGAIAEGDRSIPLSVSAQEARRRTDTLYQTDGILKQAVQQSDGVAPRAIAKGYITGEARNGDTVTFEQAFQEVPRVDFTGGVSYEPRSSMWSTSFSSTKPQYDDTAAVNLTVNGFDMRARLLQKGAVTSSGADFSTGNSLTSTGQNTALDASTSGVNNQYTFRYKVTIDIDATSTPADVDVTAVVALDSNSTAWSERNTQSFALSASAGSTNSNTWAEVIKMITVTGLSTSSNNLRTRLKSITVTSGGPLTSTEETVTVHGYSSTDSTGNKRGVAWGAATFASASKTPSTDDSVTWTAFAVS